MEEEGGEEGFGIFLDGVEGNLEAGDAEVNVEAGGEAKAEEAGEVEGAGVGEGAAGEEEGVGGGAAAAGKEGEEGTERDLEEEGDGLSGEGGGRGKEGGGRQAHGEEESKEAAGKEERGSGTFRENSRLTGGVGREAGVWKSHVAGLGRKTLDRAGELTFVLPFSFNELRTPSGNMAVKIRMQRGGSAHNPHYRVVVTDVRTPRDGRFVEKVGTYDPKNKRESEQIKLKLERIEYWLSVGAQPSDTVNSLIKRARRAAAKAAEAVAE